MKKILVTLALGLPVGAYALTTEDYARAEQFMPYNTSHLVLNVVDSPTWLDNGKLAYRTRTAQGTEIVLTDPSGGEREVVFNPARFGMPQLDEADEPFDAFTVSPDASRVSIQVGTNHWQCERESSRCSPLPARDAYAARSPDGKREVFIREFNLWLRDVATGGETQLTKDGVKDFGYATDNSARRHTRHAFVLWSPDSKRIATYQQDERGVGDMYLVRTERGHPKLEAWKYPQARDAVIPTVQRVIIEVDEARVVRLQMPPDFVRSASWLGMAHEQSNEYEAQWSADSENLAFISISRDHRTAQLRVAGAKSGAVRDVLKEQDPTFYETAVSSQHALMKDGEKNWRYLPASNEVIWYSARDGWSHLYLYDLKTGKLKKQITKGQWNVVNVVKVDERRRVIYFLGVGREAGRHPYYEHLYSVGFDGKSLARLTPEDATHSVSMSPSGDHFVDSYSQPDKAPVTVLRDRQGSAIRTLEKADISALSGSGWKPPVPITVKARDGVTDLYGLMFTPSRLDESRKYPVVNAVYPGPQIGSVFPTGPGASWATFSAQRGYFGDAQSMAELGFVVVLIDGMGTPVRSRKFHAANYGNYGDATLPDQIAGIKQLADKYSWVDIDRVGVFGISGGGYTAARAMFTYPDFYKVGVSMAGNHDVASYMDEFTEKFMGLVKPETSDYDNQNNMDIAKNLKGPLLLVHGMMDDNVPPYHTFLVIDALTKANKDFDLLILPYATHDVGGSEAGRYLVRRYWDYFVLHLLGATPPKEYGMRPRQ